MAAFHFEMHKTADFHSILLVSWELVTEGYQERPVKYVHFTHFKLKCAHFTQFNEIIERPLPGVLILWFQLLWTCRFQCQYEWKRVPPTNYLLIAKILSYLVKLWFCIHVPYTQCYPVLMILSTKLIQLFWCQDNIRKQTIPSCGWYLFNESHNIKSSREKCFYDFLHTRTPPKPLCFPQREEIKYLGTSIKVQQYDIQFI